MRADNEKLEEFYRANRRALFVLALSVTGCPDRAEDAVHEAFARMVRNGGTPRRLRPYAFRAVRNAAVDQRRRNPPAAEVPADLFDSAAGPRHAASERQFRERVLRALTGLEETGRQIVVQRLFGDLKFREIAAAMDLPLGTVTTKYRRAMERLRTELESDR